MPINNAVLILADQMRKDYLGCYGNHNAETPDIDDQYKFVQFNNGECELTDRVHDKEGCVNLAADPQNLNLVREYQAKLLMLLLRTPTKYQENISTF